MDALTREKDFSKDIEVLAQHSEVANRYFYKGSNYAVYPITDCENYDSDIYFHPSSHCGCIITDNKYYSLFDIDCYNLIWIDGFSEYYSNNDDDFCDNAILVIGNDEGWLNSRLIIFNSDAIKPKDSKICKFNEKPKFRQ